MGFVAGSAYALFALGLTLMFGVLGVVNLTYGFYFSVGAYIALFAAGSRRADRPGVAGGGDPQRARRRHRGFPASGAAAQGPRARARLADGDAGRHAVSLFRDDRPAGRRNSPLSDRPLDNAPFDPSAATAIAPGQILIVGTAAVLALGLIGLMGATRTGLAMRALAENSDAAALMGVDTQAVMRRVSFISGALGGAAGVLIGLKYNAITPYMGEAMTLKGFAIIILGGLGDIGGALVAGLLIGLLEALTAGYVSSVYKDAVGFLALVLTLWVRPLGLFGRASAKRA